MPFRTAQFFHLLSFSLLECIRKCNRNEEKRRKKNDANRYDENEKLAVNIERVIRSLKNTWTIIKPTCQRRARRVAGCLNGMIVWRRKIGCENIGKKKRKTEKRKKEKKKRDNKKTSREVMFKHNSLI